MMKTYSFYAMYLILAEHANKWIRGIFASTHISKQDKYVIDVIVSMNLF